VALKVTTLAVITLAVEHYVVTTNVITLKMYSDLEEWLMSSFTFGAIKPSGGFSPDLASARIRVPEMKSKSSRRFGSKNAIC